MSPVFSIAWLIVALPFLTFLLNGLFIARRSRQLAGLIATGSVLVSAVLVTIVAAAYLQQYPLSGDHPAVIAWEIDWLRYTEYLHVNLGVLLDPQSLLLLVVVTLVSALVHLFSLGYMADDPGSGRYFTFLNLFTFSMLGLVAAPNLIQMYIFWELVGVSSFLLIGYYYEKPSAVAASKKAFIVTRFADLFFLIGILLLGYEGYQLIASGAPVSSGLQALDFQFLTSDTTIPALATGGKLTLACLLIFVGAAGKSAMFPLHIWLPDAMEGPTPVSALIHAATMVVAGVYLVARLFPLFASAGLPLDVVAIVGAFTCLFAGVIACTQDDIKRVLAFSTLSQLGYMMLALGVSSVTERDGYRAALFHLFTHAMFKALLFLAAGAVIHAVHTNSVRQMGGLKKQMPLTHATFLVATLAIAGVFPLSGFFSKDMILAAALENGHILIFCIALLVAVITPLYMFRLYFLAFSHRARSDAAGHAHEAPLVMTLPLLILALLSAVGGFFPVDQFLSGHPAGSGHDSLVVPIAASMAAVSGILIAWLVYGRTAISPDREPFAGSRVIGHIRNKLYVDELYQFIVHRVLFAYVSAPMAWFDRHIVDGTMNLIGRMILAGGGMLRYLQTGQVQTYGVWLVSGGLISALLLWIFVR